MATEEKLVYTLKEASVVLCVSEDTVGNLTRRIDPITRQPIIKSVKIGRRKVITRRELERFLGLAA